MLCGLPGSGKTTYAKRLEQETGAIRLTLDEALFQKFGRESDMDYKERENRTKKDLRAILVSSIGDGRPVILDYGFWKKAARDEYKDLIEQNGAQWKLLYFEVPSKELRSRLAARNLIDPKDNHIIDGELLEKFIWEFEAPSTREKLRCRNEFNYPQLGSSLCDINDTLLT